MDISDVNVNTGFLASEPPQYVGGQRKTTGVPSLPGLLPARVSLLLA